MRKVLFFLSFFFIVISCNNSENTTEKVTDEKVGKKQANPPQTQKEIYLPSISVPEMKTLYHNCNQVDFIYYELPISTSLNDQYSIQQSFRHISESPVPLAVKNRCSPISRVFYKKDGEEIMEAELYFAKGCSFFVFFKEGKPAYSNLMTDSGVKHFTNIIQKALSIQPTK